MRSANPYININESRQEYHGNHEPARWYWRLVALAASWMIVAGFLLLPGLYAKDAQLKFSSAVLSVFVVALLTAGYSFTALLCFACRDASFQAYSVFLPTGASSALGLVSIVYNLFATRAYRWSNASIAGSVLGATATIVYGSLFLWRTHQILISRRPRPPRPTWSEPTFYPGYNPTLFPNPTLSPQHPPDTTAYAYTEDEGVTHQMKMLLTQRDSTPSLNAKSTYQIALPVDAEQERREMSQELVGTPDLVYTDVTSRGRADTRPDSLGEHQAWERWQERGRSAVRPSSVGARSNHSRNMSREERRTQIELGGL
ncbi:hypothetical protein IAQ61_005180 [Plenodomus lingam]|nr:hypothetical protein IAQ61_005180 [Plenodomus lingam]